MTPDEVDVAVVGAGPAGLAAAIEAARAGASVAVVDEMEKPGGQIYRQLPDGFTVSPGHPKKEDAREARVLLDEFERLPIRLITGTTVWACFEDRVLELATPERAWRLRGEAVIVATGACEWVVPLPGWTLPGVFTLGGAQTMLKSQHVLPGERILLAGTGPLLLVVASQLAAAGGHVVAVVDVVPRRALLKHVAAFLAAWPITRVGLSHYRTLMRHGARWIAPAAVTEIRGNREVEEAVVASTDADWRPIAGTERRLEVDTVCLGYSLVPAVELLRLCGCLLKYDRLARTWVPERTTEFETTIPGVFAVGDGAGVAGALVAAEEGRIAGLAAARQIECLSAREASARMRRPLARLGRMRRLRGALDEAYRLREGLQDLTTGVTTVCRCEEVLASDLERALASGAANLNQLKAWTRAGMGACQGRMCAMTTAHLAARALGQNVDNLLPITPRPPVKPVAIAALVRELAGIDAGTLPTKE